MTFWIFDLFAPLSTRRNLKNVIILMLQVILWNFGFLTFLRHCWHVEMSKNVIILKFQVILWIFGFWPFCATVDKSKFEKGHYLMFQVILWNFGFLTFLRHFRYVEMSKKVIFQDMCWKVSHVCCKVSHMCWKVSHVCQEVSHVKKNFDMWHVLKRRVTCAEKACDVCCEGLNVWMCWKGLDVWHVLKRRVTCAEKSYI
jgi:hypothetical protein